MSRFAHKASLVAGISIGTIFLWLAIRGVDLGGVARSLGEAKLWPIAPFLASLALFYWLKAVRWARLLRPTRSISARRLLPSLMIGFAGNNVLPVRLGELIRIYVLGRQQGISKTTILGTLVVERVFDLLSLLLITGIAMAITSAASPYFAAARNLLLIAGAASVIATYLIARPPLWLRRAAQLCLQPLPEVVKRTISERLSQVRQGFAIFRRDGLGDLVAISANSVAQWLLMALCVYQAMLAFDMSISPEAAIVILALVVAGISLPSAPGYVGTIEYCFVLGLGLFGVSPERALSVGIYYHAATFLSVTLAGLFFMRRINTSFREISEEAEDLRTRGT